MGNIQFNRNSNPRYTSYVIYCMHSLSRCALGRLPMKCVGVRPWGVRFSTPQRPSINACSTYRSDPQRNDVQFIALMLIPLQIIKRSCISVEIQQNNCCHYYSPTLTHRTPYFCAPYVIDYVIMDCYHGNSTI